MCDGGIKQCLLSMHCKQHGNRTENTGSSRIIKHAAAGIDEETPRKIKSFVLIYSKNIMAYSVKMTYFCNGNRAET